MKDLVMVLLAIWVNGANFGVKYRHGGHYDLQVRQLVEWFTVIADFGFPLFFLWRALHFYRLYRWVSNTPTSKIRSLAEGMVEVLGKGLRKYDMLSPISATPCIYYRLTRYTQRFSTGGRERWSMVSDVHTSNVPFWIEDETGKVMVVPQGAEIVLGPGSGVIKNQRLIGQSEKLVEYVLPESAEVYCLGFARPQKGGASVSMKDRVIARLRRLKSDKTELARYDLNGDGVIDEQEWEHARKDVQQQVAVEVLQTRTTEAGPETVIGRPGIGGLPFIISLGRPERVSARMLLFSGVLLLIGVIVFTLGVVFLTG